MQITVDRHGADRLIDISTAAAERDGRQEVHVQSRRGSTGATAEFWLVVNEIAAPLE